MIEIVSSVDAVCKDTGEIYARLFDHRPFLQGEAKYFLKEFEEKRQDGEIQKLFEILESTTEVRETQLDKAKKLGDNHFCSLTAKLEVALRMCGKVVERGEKNYMADYLQKRREERKKELEAFMNDIQEKNVKVDETFREKAQQLEQQYAELENKLHISPTHKTQNSATTSSK